MDSSFGERLTVLQRILRGRLRFTPRIDMSGKMVGYDFEGLTRFDKLFSGIAGGCPTHVDSSDRSGTEHMGAENTFDGDYGQLLDRFFRKNAEGVASPTRLNLIGGRLRRAA